MPIGKRHCHLYGGQHNGANMITPASRHMGGINVVMGDGHVRFVQEHIDMLVWWAMGSRDGGETFSSDH